MGLSVRSFSIAFDTVEPTLEQGNFIKSLSSGKIVRYIHHRELVIEIFEFPMPTLKSFLWKMID